MRDAPRGVSYIPVSVPKTQESIIKLWEGLLKDIS